jgi:hypothetical protein
MSGGCKKRKISVRVERGMSVHGAEKTRGANSTSARCKLIKASSQRVLKVVD